MNHPIQPLATEDVSLPATPPVEIVTPKIPNLPHHQLLATLYFLLDAFDRTQITFFLVRQTAKDVKSLHELTGNKLEIGVRNNEWLNGNQEILFPYFEQERVELTSELPNELTYVWQGTPFTIHFYQDNECITALVPFSYEHEMWNLPNQFERFEKEFDHD